MGRRSSSQTLGWKLLACQAQTTRVRGTFTITLSASNGPSGVPRITGKRNIFQSLEGSPDGIKIAANGYLVVASGLSLGVDILTADGSVIARIQTNHPVENIAFAGDDLKTLYLVGIGGVSKVEWNLAGPDPKNYYI
ncbi:hypothetical protein LEMA_P002590.1 [Plenodomus lingam JN3]|uniref:SMP-30/Gluconolactonase/LRE-like region domain-containing protein n=1 Tax=Leptosphaeria maculans (strain JN3 / isolate v23.1.3 / race Av1-4-5-6-7-8) TaxID=985895 RepID=E5AE33_LEPMJ|nr:hypothetical protein LEMA_P002590.1 [Plenodomus lingam JN3]CBY01472.1 hypothetical protein LEMA_P002590.1 [Plenodomus lingam JN3]